MNNLNPIIQEAIKPFVPKEYDINELIRLIDKADTVMQYLLNEPRFKGNFVRVSEWREQVRKAGIEL